MWLKREENTHTTKSLLEKNWILDLAFFKTMPHSTLLKFTFQYDQRSMIPLVPVNFFYKDGTPTQPFQDAVLDSGANQITIPKALALSFFLFFFSLHVN